MSDPGTLTLEPTATLDVALTEPDYICPVCQQPVYPGEDEHDHLADWLDDCQG